MMSVFFNFFLIFVLSTSCCRSASFSDERQITTSKNSYASKSYTSKKKRPNQKKTRLRKFLIRRASKGSSIRRLKLKKLRYVKHIRSRSAGGVYLVKDSKGNKYTLKFNKERRIDRFPFLRRIAKFFHTLPREIVADSVYRSLGLSVPDFVVYDRLPNSLRKIAVLRKKRGMVRIAEFIPSRQISERERNKIFKSRLQSKFAVLLAFLNRDIKPQNLVLGKDSDEPWFIDNDWFLHASFFLFYKNHFPKIGKDIKRFKSEGHTKQWYRNIKQTEIKRQIRLFLKKETKVMRTFRVVSRRVKLTNRFSYLIHLKARFKALRRFVEGSGKRDKKVKHRRKANR